VPALETIARRLSLPGARALSPARRAALESKAVACRLGQGDCQAALAHCRELLRVEASIDSVPILAQVHLQCADWSTNASGSDSVASGWTTRR
jgi:hypothetical protein